MTDADGLLQAPDEGFQYLLRLCGDEWVKLLKANIEAWLRFVIQNVNAGLLGETASLAAAEVMDVPEVRCLLSFVWFDARFCWQHRACTRSYTVQVLPRFKCQSAAVLTQSPGCSHPSPVIIVAARIESISPTPPPCSGSIPHSNGGGGGRGQTCSAANWRGGVTACKSTKINSAFVATTLSLLDVQANAAPRSVSQQPLLIALSILRANSGARRKSSINTHTHTHAHTHVQYV